MFYEDDKSPKTKKIVTTLEKLEFKEYPDLPFVRCSDTAEAAAFGVKPEELPQIVLFFNGIPDEYEGEKKIVFQICKLCFGFQFRSKFESIGSISIQIRFLNVTKLFSTKCF